ncbi:amidohydrolase family protein [Actinoplanes sp. Pm04-4]|uniref:Amidohydrolase family protein n=1 Tax=Paractinoplanes pyxinae TaxID=2997416 RepID=A0ABT4AZH3_9ACTN|nr:amidohydrolase family protein [Actinoplanes pyxinae]MCY1139639.1 amidohydrolase family protein [Actinoplanes pyxinae]
MFRRDGESWFVVDGHTQFWDGSPANQINRYGEGYVRCLHDFHRRLSPAEHRWSLAEFERYPEERLIHDLFETGYDDVAILQPADRPDWFVNGFDTTEQNGEVAERHPGRFVVNGRWDPRDGEAGLDRLEALHERWQLPGVMVCTAEWKGVSKGWRLSDPWACRYLEKCEELGIRNIHVQKGPAFYPMSRDAADVADVDDAATAFPGLRFVVEHVGLPRIEEFCWIATQEPNVYGGLAAALPFLHTRPRYFARILGELLYWIGEDRILFGSAYAIWHPKWLIERFAAFQIPEDMQGEYGLVTPEMKRKILGLNAARLYDLKVE